MDNYGYKLSGFVSSGSSLVPTQTFSYGTPTNSVNARSNTTVSLSGTLGNTGTGDLAISLSSTGTLSVTSLSPSSGTVAPSGSTTVTGTINTGTTAGARGWQVTNTDANATNNPITISGTVNVYDYANATYSGATLDFGNVHQGATVAAQTVAFGNQTVTDANFQDLLDVSAVTGNALVMATGFTGLAASAGGVTTDNLSFTVDTSTVGSLASTAALTLTSNANGVSGLSNGTATVVGSPTEITTTGYVYSGQGVWNTDGSGNWNDFSRWETNGGVPGLDTGFTTTDTATFGSGATTANPTVSLNGASPSVRAVTFDNSSQSYLIDATGGGTLILNGGGDGAAVTVLAGSHEISAPVTLSDYTYVTVANAGDQLKISGVIEGDNGLAVQGAGKLTLTGENTYTGGTTVWGGATLVISEDANLGALPEAAETNLSFVDRLVKGPPGPEEMPNKAAPPSEMPNKAAPPSEMPNKAAPPSEMPNKAAPPSEMPPQKDPPKEVNLSAVLQLAAEAGEVVLNANRNIAIGTISKVIIDTNGAENSLTITGSIATTPDVPESGITPRLSKEGLGTLILTGQSEGVFDLAVQAGSLIIQDGGTFSGINGYVVDNGASEAAATVTGKGSEWNSVEQLVVAVTGNGTLDVLDGGYVSAGSVQIAASKGATATVTVSGRCSELEAFGDMYVGNFGGNGTLNINRNGAVFVGQNLSIGGSHSAGTVTVSGRGSELDVGNSLIVGDYGTGVLNLQNCALVSVGECGWGTLILGNYEGGSGTLNIGTGGLAGTLEAAEVHGGDGQAIVAFNHTDDIIFDAKITGSVSLTKDGSGITELTACSTYTGTTNVNAGVLAITGSLRGVGDVTVAVDAFLTGDGSITTAEDHSVFLNGTLSVQSVGCDGAASFSVHTSGDGALVMGAGSVIAVDLFRGAGLGDNTSLRGASDVLNLTGQLDATAGGILLIGNPNHMTGFHSGDTWQVINLNEGDGSIIGTLALSDSSLGLSSTQAGKFDSTTGTYTVVDTVGGLQTAALQDQAVLSSLQNALGDINGRLFNLRAGGGEEGSDGSIASSIDDGVIVGQGDGPEDGPIAKKVLRSRQWEVYTTVNYANVSLSGIGTQAGMDAQTWSPSVGIERHVTRSLSVGFASSFINTHQSYANSLGTLNIQGLGLSAYASYVHRAFWVSTLYSFGMLDIDSSRNPGVGLPTANGDTAAYTNTVQFNTGWNFRFQNNTFVTGPFVGVDYTNVAVDAYTETGGGIGALAYGSRSMDSLISRVGWSASKKFTTDWAVITPQLRLSYERQNITNNNATSASLVNLPFTATTKSQAPGQDYMVVGAGVNFEFSEALSIMLSYSTQLFRQDMQAHFGGVRIGYKF